MANIYVSPTGNDTTGDGSSLTPYQHIHKAVSVLSVGDVIICKDGTYDEENGFTAPCSFTIKSESEDYTKVILKPAQSWQIFGTLWGYISILSTSSGPKFIKFQDITIHWFEGHFTGGSTRNDFVISRGSGGEHGVTFDRCFLLGDGDTATNILEVAYENYSRNAEIRFNHCTVRNFTKVASDVQPLAVNSIFEGNGAVFSKANSGYPNAISDYNCFYNNTTDFDGTYSVTYGDNDITLDPEFEDTTSAVISTSSPCVDTGVVIGNSKQIGPEEPYGATNTGAYGIQFSVLDNITFKTCTISSGSNGNCTVELWKFSGSQTPSAGTLIDSAVVSLTTGLNNVTLDLTTDGPGYYWLGRQVGLDLMRSDADIIFPIYFNYETGCAKKSTSFTSNSAIARWYTFFNLVIEFTQTGDSPLGDGPDIGVYEVSAGENILVDENLTLSESDTLNVSQETIEVDESLTLNDINDLSANSISVTESLTLAESDELIRHAIDVNENLTLNDSQIVDVNKIEIDESLTLSEIISLSTISPVEYASKILSVNPLFVTLNTSPAKIAKIDTSDVFNPTWEVYTITGCSNVNNISYNSTTGHLYILCDSGELVKFLASDLSSYTIIDTLDTDNLELGSVFSDEFKMFVGTDDDSGEIIVVDEANVESLSLDIRYIQRVTNHIPLFINTVLGKKVNLDIRYSKTISTTFGLDIRFLKYDYSQVSQSPLTYDDWQVKIDNVDMIPLNDIDMKSIVITHTADSKSSASFVLHRVHDKLNYRNDGVASQITNNNTVKIYIDGEEEFNGKISSIEVDSESERVMVNAKMNEPADSRHKVNIPIPSVNEQLHLYHCLRQIFTIDNPSIDSEEENPEYYKGIKVDLGVSIKQKIQRYTSFTDVASQIQAGAFTPKQNWSYFWLASIKYLFTSGMFGETSSIVSNRYIGTSLQSITSDVIELNSANYCYQREYDDLETELGYHYVGNAPYMEISSANGRLTTKQRWDDREDGLYIIKDSSYDYVNYAKQIASLEYEKLQNINGAVLPIVNGEITLTLNGYYFYNVKLLTRINLTNTTTSGIYKDLNGFPVSVKSIRISSSDMKVQLSCNNQKSQQEIEEIDARYPVQEDYQTQGTESRVYRKYDIAKKVYVS